MITRSLAALGVNLGHGLLEPSFDNPKGFFEDKAVVNLDQVLLRFAGAAWDRPPDPGSTVVRMLSVGKHARAASFLMNSRLRASAPFGLKDPRMCVLLPFWRPVLSSLSANVRCILALRHPLSVAESLRCRNEMPLAVGCALWLRYTLEAVVEASKSWPCVVVEYESVLRRPRAQLARMARLFALRAEPNKSAEFASSFLDRALCHDYRKDVDGLKNMDRGDLLYETYRLLQSAASSDEALTEPSYADLRVAWIKAFGA